MAFESIKLEVFDDGVAVLELNRPERLNAFNRQMIGEWREALAQIADDRRVRAVVLTGAGRAFCAGGDADEMTEMQTAHNVERKEYLWRSIQKIPLAMERLEQPVIAAINGTARGAGLDMALMCDIRLCGTSSTFAESYINMGVLSGDGGTWFLPRVIGVSRALELLWTGRVVDAAEAERIGMVNRVVADADVRSEALALARQIAAQPPQAVALMKRAVYHGLTGTLAAHLDMVSSHMVVVFDTPEFNQRLNAFHARRKS
ncbi:MAG TPA: enoyl-CoA hydratase-related protein [Burkholderiales bacterium]|nr:enoyl-CoA hydratase-related protein [Burkholderiales bacterium]